MSEGVTAALEAMRADAKTWEDAASDLTQPKETVAGLTVEPAQVGMHAVDAGLDKTYEEARAAIEAMIKKAENYFNKLSTDLTDSANQYESDDQSAQEELNSTQ